MFKIPKIPLGKTYVLSSLEFKMSGSWEQRHVDVMCCSFPAATLDNRLSIVGQLLFTIEVGGSMYTAFNKITRIT